MILRLREMLKNRNKHKTGFSLLELLVTIVIFGILVVMLVQVLILNLRVSRMISLRSRIRSELSETSLLIRRDFRNSSRIVSDRCGSTVGEFGDQPGCVYVIANKTFAWVLGSEANDCPTNKLCRFEEIAGVLEPNYISSDLYDIDPDKTTFEIQEYSDINETVNAILLVTLHIDILEEELDIAPQVRQITVSTRNL